MAVVKLQKHELLQRLKNSKRINDNEYTSLCPAHDDKENSLAISEGNDGRILLFCHAGCTSESVVSALGLKMSDLYPGVKTKVKRIVSVYQYKDLNGNVIHETVRYDPKGFTQRVPDGKGGFIYSLKGIDTIIYNLSAVSKAIQKGETVFIVEGEKDCNNAAKIGLTATTSPQGAGKWKNRYSDYLKDSNVVIIPDNDEAGKKHSQQIAKSLLGKAKSIKLIELPGLPVKGDLTEWYKLRHYTTELLQLIESTTEWKPPEISPSIISEPSKQFRLSELGNAERLVHRHGKDIRFCHTWNKWLIWTGTYWKIDETGEIERKAKDTIRYIYSEAASIDDDAQRTALVKHAAKSESNRAITAMIELAKSEQSIPITSEHLDNDIWLLNCRNGTLDLRTGELKPHNRNDFITKLIPLRFDSTADFIEWARFLDRILGGNQNLISFLQRAIGYSLTGSTREQCLFILHGNGANGKSTFLDVISGLLNEYGQQTPIDTLMMKDTNGISNDIARLKGARFVVASEIEEGRRMAESLVKQMTGGEKLTARFMRSEFFEFKPQFKLWIGTNHRPIIKGTDSAIWRRIKLIPFNVTIPPEERDKELNEKLKDELSGVLNWAVMGCLEWLKDGLGEPEEVTAATDNYKSEMDAVSMYLDECCDTDTKICTRASEIYQCYSEWCKNNGEYPINQRNFGIRLTEKGFIKHRSTGGVYLYDGIRLLKEGETMNPFKAVK